MYKEVGTWFRDQEIFDYVYERLESLKAPDCRLYVKAYNRKKAGLKNLNWRRLIDDYCDDKEGLQRALEQMLEHPETGRRIKQLIAG